LTYGGLLALIYPSVPVNLQKRIMHRWSVELLVVLHVRIRVTGDIKLGGITQGLIIANHISWLDVFVMSSVLPMRFVAKSEVRSWPFIGWLCARADTIFIERNKRSDTIRTNIQAVEHLQKGNCMAIFPEGTTSDGKQIGHFHASLLQPAIDSQTPIYPVGIHYHDSTNKPNYDAAYIGEMTFVESMWKILSSRDLHVRLTTAPPLATQAANRRVLALEARRRIAHVLSIEPPAVTSPLHVSEEEQLLPASFSMLLCPPLNTESHEIH
jgi:1-acyl-sn-glycerol-3-phosphate acyltransferase